MTKDNEVSGMIYNIQRFSIHDGPGIRTTVFLKGCPLSCFWCHNPESQSRQPEIFLNREKCTSCGLCIPACSVSANSFDSQGSIAIDRKRCSGCGQCVGACPAGARTLMGKEYTVDEVMDVVIRDKKYYRSSGGGVTISGGEPLAQPEFACAVLKRCREEGIHTLVETSGFAAWETLEAVLQYTDLVYYDIKCIDAERHKNGTGVRNERILENAVKTAKIVSMLVRVPVIPYFNDDPEELEKIAVFARDRLGQETIELLKYNKLCQSKYIRLDRPFQGQVDTPTDAEMEAHMKELNEKVKAAF